MFSAATFGGSFSSFGEQLFGAALGKKNWGAALGNIFVKQLWGAALGSRSSLEEQFCATAANKNFEKPQLWGLALERKFGGQLSLATLRSSFRGPLWRMALGNRFGE